MNLADLNITTVAAIIVICYLIGYGVRCSGIDNKWIPLIVGVAGAILGLVGMKVIPNFPAQDALNSIAVGIMSGLTAVGFNQIVKQLGRAN